MYWIYLLIGAIVAVLVVVAIVIYAAWKVFQYAVGEDDDEASREEFFV